MDLSAYLARIGYDGPVTPTLETLRGMHRAHFFHVPFENLDIARGVEIAVDEEVNFEKIVRRRRGGFCLEVTGMFARALREIGFRVDVVGARVRTEGQLSAALSHMTLVVHLEEAWVADVGFGGRIIEPLRMAERGEQVSGLRAYVVANDGDHWFVTCREGAAAPGMYTFVHQPRAFEEFRGVCRWLQTSPDSRFTKGDVVTLPTADGRVTYSTGRLTIAAGATRTETPVAAEELDAVLRERFGIAV